VTAEEWVPLQEAFERLCARFTPDATCAMLNNALVEGRPHWLRLRADKGVALDPGFIRTNLALRLDKRLCVVEPMRAWTKRPEDFIWEVAGIEALLPIPKKRGRKGVQNWDLILYPEFERLRRADSPLLKDAEQELKRLAPKGKLTTRAAKCAPNLDRLYEHAAAHVLKMDGKPPKDRKRFLRAIRAYLMGTN
jgi:hypothetical protein